MLLAHQETNVCIYYKVFEFLSVRILTMSHSTPGNKTRSPE